MRPSSAGPCAILLAIHLHAGTVWAEPSHVLPGREPERRALYRAGVDAIKKENWNAARASLGEAYGIRPSYDVALFLAQAEFNLKEYRSAAEHLEYYLTSFPAKEAEFSLFNAQRAFELSKQHVGAIVIVVEAPAEVFVDGTSLGHAPLEQTVFVEPGSHRIRAELEGTSASRTVATEGGRTVTVELNLRQDLSAPSEPPASRTAWGASTTKTKVARIDPLEHDDSRNLLPVVLGAAGVVAGTGMAMGFGLAAAANDDRIDDISERYGTSYCASGTDPICDRQRHLIDRRDRNRTLATAGVVVAGASLAATAVYWLWPREHERNSVIGSLRADAMWLPESAGVQVSGSF